MELGEKQECPICGCETGHVNNHVRMSNDGDHGPTQAYPDGWDPSTEEVVQENGDDDDGNELDLVDGDDDGDEPGAVAISIDDRPSDMREYECGECEASVEYLDSECPNEHEQQWYA